MRNEPSHQNLDHLNRAQQKAVSAPVENILVLAGAGSGKTRVLTQRIAWLIQNELCSPFNILAVTFTNKAASEMRGRVERLLGYSSQNLWIGTFHGLCHRLLRIHHDKSGLNENFQIMDSDDQLRVVKRIVAAMGLDEKQWIPKKIQWFINAKKDDGYRATKVPNTADLHTRTLIRIYQQYEETCLRMHLVDFAELLLRTQELFERNPDILEHYQSRFTYILVDEFQDTNAIQYHWIKTLAQKSTLMAVGDDDQSIYGWRGAKIENMKALERDFHPLQVQRLEQNYRSTGNILKAANCLIENNTDRLGKNLWTEDGHGEKISLYCAFNEFDEARFIVESIREYYKQEQQYLHCAILYRSNTQSRVIEEALIQAGIPYRIYGGLRFFERQEIKDALGYLKLILNPEDDTGFERVINTPPRGLGEQSLKQLRDYAKEHTVSLWQSALISVEQKTLSARALNSLQSFIQLIQTLQQETTSLNLSALTDLVIFKSGLIHHYQNEKGEKGQTRIENLQELITAAGQFSEENTNNVHTLLAEFLANAALEAGESQSDESATDYVQLMTLHSAKGLEFPLVFLAGMEEGLFPHQLSASEPHQLSEERRLCYVGITRAMKKLYLTHAETRRHHGQEMYHRPSRFIQELPHDVLDEVKLRTKISRPVYSSSHKSSHYPPPMSLRSSSSAQQTQFNQQEMNGLKLGQSVKHPTFGEGTIINFEGSGEYARVQVKFKQVGPKWLVASYAKLEVIS
jgi:DNA helicase-2/ATP-dependent DNA helicase PcrA